MKQYLLLLLATSPLIASTVPPQDYLHGQQQLFNYVDHYTQALFSPHNVDSRPIAETIYYGEPYWNRKVFRYDHVKQVIHSEVLREICQNARFYLERKESDTTMREAVIDALRAELINTLEQSTLNGKFAPFVGKQLENQLEQILTQQRLKRQTQQLKLYPTEACVSCLEDFDQQAIEQIFLIPCGHDICKNCAHNWFFWQNKDTCPLCRAQVDKQRLSEIVHGP